MSHSLVSSSLLVSVGKDVESEYVARALAQVDPRAFRKARDQARTGGLQSLRTDRDILDYCWKKQAAREERATEGPLPIHAALVQEALRESWWSLDSCSDEDCDYRPFRSCRWRNVRIVLLMVFGAVWPDVLARVTKNQPAFSFQYQFLKAKRTGFITLNPALLQMLDKESLGGIVSSVRLLPMIVPPRLWIDWDDGAFMTHRGRDDSSLWKRLIMSCTVHVMRIKDSSEQRSYLKQTSEAGELDRIYAALDFLGATPWVINRPILDVMAQAWNNGDEIGKLPVADPLINIKDPPRPTNADDHPQSLREWRKACQRVAQDRRSAHSARCDLNYKLEIARAVSVVNSLL